MSSDRVVKHWREQLITKLRDRYELSMEEAEDKADVWLNWLQQQPTVGPEKLGRTRRPGKSALGPASDS